MTASLRVVIVGGGISGTAAAYELSRRSADVVLLESGTLASMGSGRTLAGVRQSGRHEAELPLAMAAVKRWENLHEELGVDLEYRQRGNLRLARQEAEIPKIRAMVEKHRGSGLEIEFLYGNEAVREIAPALDHHIVAASFCPTDGQANPVKTVQAFADAAQRHGAKIIEHCLVKEITAIGDRVTGVTTADGHEAADAVVVAAGIDSPELLRPLGIEIPIQIGFVPVIQSVPIPPLLEQVLGTARAHFAARQQVDGCMRFSSGGVPFRSADREIDDDTMQPTTEHIWETLGRAIEILPDLRNVAIRQVWGGLIDLTPDGIPVIGKVNGLNGLVVAAGFCGHGFCLGPVTGEVIRNLLLDQSCTYAIDAFAVERFTDSGEFADYALHG
jgi:sarcosine oxidase, subunit beta